MTAHEHLRAVIDSVGEINQTILAAEAFLSQGKLGPIIENGVGRCPDNGKRCHCEQDAGCPLDRGHAQRKE